MPPLVGLTIIRILGAIRDAVAIGSVVALRVVRVVRNVRGIRHQGLVCDL